MPPAGFEPAIPVDERLQTHALDRSATAIGTYASVYLTNILKLHCVNRKVFLVLKKASKHEAF